MNQWIPVDGSLPEERVVVLTAINTGPGEFDWELELMCYIDGQWFSPDMETSDSRVSHWQAIGPLPEGKTWV